MGVACVGVACAACQLHVPSHNRSLKYVYVKCVIAAISKKFLSLILCWPELYFDLHHLISTTNLSSKLNKKWRGENECWGRLSTPTQGKNDKIC